MLGEVGDAAKAAGLFVGGARDFDGTGKLGHQVTEDLCSDDRGGKAALHVAGAAAVDLAVLELAAERIEGPAAAGFDHVVMRVEVHRLARPAALAPGDDVPARILVAVADRALGANQFNGIAGFAQALGEVIADFAVVVPGRIDRRNADQVLRQRDQVVATRVDFGTEPGM